MLTLPEVLTLERPLIGLDLESTGINTKQDCIVQIGLEIMVPGEPTREYKTLVNPVIPIPADATAIHGITNEHVANAPTFKQLASNLAKGLTNVDFVTYNGARFDFLLLTEEFVRAAEPWDFENARVIDGYRLWQIIEGRTLTNAIERWLRPSTLDKEVLDAFEQETAGDAHDALWDIRMTSRIVASQIANSDMPRDLDELHKLQWPGRYDALGKLKWKDNELVITFGNHRDKPIARVPRGYLEWMIGADFSEKVKDACRAQLAGRPLRLNP